MDEDKKDIGIVEDNTTTKPDDALTQGNLDFSVSKGLIGFAIGFLAIGILEVFLLLLMGEISGRQVMPRGLGWLIMPFTCGAAGYKFFSSFDVYNALLRRVNTPQQRKALLLLGISLLFLVGQLIVYACNVSNDWNYWDSFWSGFSSCLSLGHHYCSDSYVISRRLVYFDLICIIASLTCTFWWHRVTNLRTSIQQWVVNG